MNVDVSPWRPPDEGGTADAPPPPPKMPRHHRNVDSPALWRSSPKPRPFPVPVFVAAGLLRLLLRLPRSLSPEPPRCSALPPNPVHVEALVVAVLEELLFFHGIQPAVCRCGSSGWVGAGGEGADAKAVLFKPDPTLDPPALPGCMPPTLPLVLP